MEKYNWAPEEVRYGWISPWGDVVKVQPHECHYTVAHRIIQDFWGDNVLEDYNDDSSGFLEQAGWIRVCDNCLFDMRIEQEQTLYLTQAQYNKLQIWADAHQKYIPEEKVRLID